MLTKIEKKMVAKYPAICVRDCGKTGFILSDGWIIKITDHAAVCKSVGLKLSKVLQSGICRFMFHEGKEGKKAAFEYTSLTVQQKSTISLLLRADDYYMVITTKNTVSRFRPIRSISF